MRPDIYWKGTLFFDSILGVLGLLVCCGPEGTFPRIRSRSRVGAIFEAVAYLVNAWMVYKILPLIKI